MRSKKSTLKTIWLEPAHNREKMTPKGQIIHLGAPGNSKLEPLGAAAIIAQFLYENNEPGLFVPQRFTHEELRQLKAQENYKV